MAPHNMNAMLRGQSAQRRYQSKWDRLRGGYYGLQLTQATTDTGVGLTPISKTWIPQNHGTPLPMLNFGRFLKLSIQITA